MPDLTPDEAAHLAARAGLPLEAARHTNVAAVANHIHSVVSVLRDLDFGDTAPASTYQAEEDVRVAG
ncbi:hypothetical protein [Amycolatopsis circi]|uniref:hypothetical protein n=1 Tax=Amycolatopsis circi TaxID=871959 RepID=UPI000E262EEE|nr:hypothetical protein [Amycolatopsis circi]